MATGGLSSRHEVNWLGLPVVATVARLLCRELTLQNEYLRVENSGASINARRARWVLTTQGGSHRTVTLL